MAIPTSLILGLGAGGAGAIGALINANDNEGIMSITTGLAPAALSIVATLNFGEPFEVKPNQILLTPANQFSAELGAGWVWAPDTLITIAKFDIKAPTIPLVAGTTYKWYYRVIG